MASFEIQVDPRDVAGTGSARALRRDGRVPAVFYMRGEEAKPITVEDRALAALLRRGGRSHLLKLQSSDKALDGQHALIKDLQSHPYKNILLHVDFQGVSLKEQVTLRVPIETSGVPKGADKGGVLEQKYVELEVRCRADAIPESIRIDLAPLDLGAVVHAGDLELPDGVELTMAPEIMVLAVLLPKRVAATAVAEGAEESETGEEAEAADEEAAAGDEAEAGDAAD